MEISLGRLAFDLDFHPSSELVSAGLISGDLHLYRYGANALPQRLLEVRAHTESCRAVRFIDGGRAIATCSPDRSILATDVETGSPIARLEDAHGDAINRLINISETTIASGDDEGCIKVWDTRQRSCCNSFDAHHDYVSDMTFASDASKLLSTSGDGTLSVCSLRRNKVQAQSEFSEEELLSVVIMKNGLISLVGILPNRIIQPIAEHSEYPVERLAFSHDRKFLGSIAHDQMLKLWDLDDILQTSGKTPTSEVAEKDSDSDEMDVETSPPKNKGTKRKGASIGNELSSSNSFFADL
ncbi:hypothetical protein I3843_03G089600 [Carya illinoinensis]|uniref:WD repeat-containing protein 55 n=1 Tax=Carya illinoinensis TaxID=32201 RepID=A0A922FF99_CARIL|nr:hypothetical protein I3842_03G090100 [Carya illinoinensis]KAG7986599.1 hypothetical protein I3843_03G089600 [Carya illinoinensis]